MKITPKTNTKRRALKYGLILFAVALLVGAGIIYWLKVSSEQSASTNGPTPAEQKQMQEVDNSAKKAFAEETKDTDNPGVVVPTPTTPDTIELSASKADTATVTVFTKLKNYASGNCELTVTNGARTHSATAQILYQPEYSSCAGFSVPLSELGAGTWTVKLVATPTGGSAVTKTITAEIK